MIKHHLKTAGKILTKADIFLILLLITIAFFLLFTFRNDKDDSKVYIYLHNELVREADLSETRQIIELNQDITLEIHHQKVRVLVSDCEEQICVKQGWTANLPLVCVPNELLVVIRRKKASEKLLITS